jgi:tRNA pseudouridine32 synthase/23S rRNA pseudouridine746 synthase
MMESKQFFKMRELVAEEMAENEPLNSETWIDCVEPMDFSDSAIQTISASPPSLARYVLKPLTGQRHQLRVHMNSLGLPLMGDQFYPVIRRAANEPDDFSSPLQLLAKSIAFKDPLTGVARRFESCRVLKFD